MWQGRPSQWCRFYRGEKTLQGREYLKLSVFKASKLKLFTGISFLGLDDFILLYVTPMPHCWKNVATCDPGPPLAVVWAVSTRMHLEYIHIWPPCLQTVTQGLSRDSVWEPFLYSTQSLLNKDVQFNHDFNPNNIVCPVETGKWWGSAGRLTPLPWVRFLGQSGCFDICV